MNHNGLFDPARIATNKKSKIYIDAQLCHLGDTDTVCQQCATNPPPVYISDVHFFLRVQSQVQARRLGLTSRPDGIRGRNGAIGHIGFNIDQFIGHVFAPRFSIMNFIAWRVGIDIGDIASELDTAAMKALTSQHNRHRRVRLLAVVAIEVCYACIRDPCAGQFETHNLVLMCFTVDCPPRRGRVVDFELAAARSSPALRSEDWIRCLRQIRVSSQAPASDFSYYGHPSAQQLQPALSDRGSQDGRPA